MVGVCSHSAAVSVCARQHAVLQLLCWHVLPVTLSCMLSCWCLRAALQLVSTQLVLCWLSYSPASAVLACASEHAVLQPVRWGVVASMLSCSRLAGERAVVCSCCAVVSL
jgi:hypothetical protein